MAVSPLPLRPHERILTQEDGCVETPPRAPTPVHNFGTLAVHAGSPLDPSTGAVIEPISLSTTFGQTGVGKPIGQYEYSRSSNPNRYDIEYRLCSDPFPDPHPETTLKKRSLPSSMRDSLWPSPLALLPPLQSFSL